LPINDLYNVSVKSVTVKGIILYIKKAGNVIAINMSGDTTELITANTSILNLTDALNVATFADVIIVTGQRVVASDLNKSLFFATDIPSGTRIRGSITYASFNYTPLS